MATRTRQLRGTKKNFGATPPVQLSRSTFDLSKKWKGTFDAGYLVPFYVSEGLPGDSRRVRVDGIFRLATPLKPLMDNLYLDFHFWWCPNRQLYDKWEKIMGEQENPGDSIDFLFPQARQGQDADADILGDYMGLPPASSGQLTTSYLVSAGPWRMYNRVYNFHYRDQNLISSVPQATDDGPDTMTDYKLLRRGKRHDYLTASLPFQQKGDPISLPLGTTAPVIANIADAVPLFRGETGETADRNMEVDAGDNLDLTTTPGTGKVSWAEGFKGATANAKTGLVVDLTVATASSITDLRQAIAFQHVLERDARSGSRYPEILLSRFRVMDPQMLVLQRPEYLGGGTKALTVTPVPQTSSDPTEATPQGNLAAVGVSIVSGIGFTRSFTEHGFIMGIMSARQDYSYQQGVERMWNRRSRFDWYHPELAHLSEQAVLKKEIYVTGTAVDDDSVWGYIGAYDEYRYGQSLVTSLFRSSAAQSLDVWHLAQQFATPPTLNQTFIEENPPVDRVIAVQDEPHFICELLITDIAARPMPISGIPGLSRI